MKTKHILLVFIVGVILFQGCEKEKHNLIDSKEIQSIAIRGIKNLIGIKTDSIFQLKVDAYPINNAMKEIIPITYISSNERIFTVDEDGLLRGITPGEANLTIKLEDNPNILARYLVRVADEIVVVREIALNDQAINFVLPLQEETTVNYGFSIYNLFEVLPNNASNKSVDLVSSDTNVIKIDTVSGQLIGTAIGTSDITIKSKDGSSVSSVVKVEVRKMSYPPTNRTNWTVTTSHNLPKDDAIQNSSKSLIDGNLKTALSLVKAGKKYNDIGVDKNAEVFFVIDMKQANSFDFIRIDHRKGVGEGLRPYVYDLYGTNEIGGLYENFATINALPKQDTFIMNFNSVKYRFLKVVLVDDKGSSGGNTMQIAEFSLGQRK